MISMVTVKGAQPQFYNEFNSLMQFFLSPALMTVTRLLSDYITKYNNNVWHNCLHLSECLITHDQAQKFIQYCYIFPT